MLPEHRDTSSNLQEAKKIFLGVDYLLGLHEISNIGVVINSSANESSTCHCMSSSRNQKDCNYFAWTQMNKILLHISLYQRYSPERVNVKAHKVLCYLVVPKVPFVLIFVTVFEVVVGARCIFEVENCLPLQTGSQISSITEVKALTGEHFLNAINEIYNILWQHSIARNVSIERNKLNIFYLEDVVA